MPVKKSTKITTPQKEEKKNLSSFCCAMCPTCDPNCADCKDCKSCGNCVITRQPKKSFTTPVMVILLIIAAFIIGSLYTKLQYLQNGSNNTQALGTQTGAQISPATQPARTAFIAYAKQIGLNVNKFTTCLDSHKYKQNVTDSESEGTKLGVQGTPSFFINGIGLVGALPYDMFKTVIDHELAGSIDPLPTTIPAQPRISGITPPILPVLGNSNAPVTIVEFSDFQCPFCESFFTNSLPQLKKDYIDTGRVKLDYRFFPLTSIHPNAEGSAEAAACANEQGKFWQMHDVFFQNQNAWVNDTPLAGA